MTYFINIKKYTRSNENKEEAKIIYYTDIQSPGQLKTIYDQVETDQEQRP